MLIGVNDIDNFIFL